MNKNILKTILISILILSLNSFLVEAHREISITSTNLAILKGFSNSAFDSSGRLFWYYVHTSGGNLVLPYHGLGSTLSVPYKQKVGSCYLSTSTAVYNGCTQVDDLKGLYPGECVSFCKSLSNMPVEYTTSTWRRGNRQVMAGGIAEGKVIATFNSAGYFVSGSNHCAIFKNYIKDSTGKIIGFEVWDQNWLKDYVVRKHIIKSGASSYYALTIP